MSVTSPNAQAGQVYTVSDSAPSQSFLGVLLSVNQLSSAGSRGDVLRVRDGTGADLLRVRRHTLLKRVFALSSTFPARDSKIGLLVLRSVSVSVSVCLPHQFGSASGTNSLSQGSLRIDAGGLSVGAGGLSSGAGLLISSGGLQAAGAVAVGMTQLPDLAVGDVHHVAAAVVCIHLWCAGRRSPEGVPCSWQRRSVRLSCLAELAQPLHHAPDVQQRRSVFDRGKQGHHNGQ